jgi:hypothetical protein
VRLADKCQEIARGTIDDDPGKLVIGIFRKSEAERGWGRPLKTCHEAGKCFLGYEKEHAFRERRVSGLEREQLGPAIDRGRRNSHSAQGLHAKPG